MGIGKAVVLFMRRILARRAALAAKKPGLAPAVGCPAIERQAPTPSESQVAKTKDARQDVTELRDEFVKTARWYAVSDVAIRTDGWLLG